MCTRTRDDDKRHRPELADIFRRYGEDYRRNHPMPASHHKIMHDIMACRTAQLGGHLEQCDSCGFERPAYNSCRNRHCPKCQALANAEWVEARRADLLPVGYFHDVFTLPHELNPIILTNKMLMYSMLFKAVSGTLLEFGKDPKHRLGGKIGIIAVLHTWDQTLGDHIHLHCLIPAGALGPDASKWIHASPKFLFPIKALSRAFRATLIRHLKKAFKKGEIIFPGNTVRFGTKRGFSRLIDALWKKDWVVYSKKPLPRPEDVLDYLGRYVHRVAISNDRIIDIENDTVSFWYKKRCKDKRPLKKKMRLKAAEFIRRYLLHALPEDFVRIRYFGLLANRDKKECLRKCRILLGASAEIPKAIQKGIKEYMLALTGGDISQCPRCKKGTMVTVREIPRPSLIRYPHKPKIFDSS